MDFHLTNEQQMLRKMYREFAENEVKPLAEEIDEEERFPMETVEKMAKLGMMGIYFPKEYGGAGGDVLSYAMCVEELAKVCGTTAVIVSAHTSLCCAPIFEHGTEEQKRKYLPDLLSGKKIKRVMIPNVGDFGNLTVKRRDYGNEPTTLRLSKYRTVVVTDRYGVEELRFRSIYKDADGARQTSDWTNLSDQADKYELQVDMNYAAWQYFKTSQATQVQISFESDSEIRPVSALYNLIGNGDEAATQEEFRKWYYMDCAAMSFDPYNLAFDPYSKLRVFIKKDQTGGAYAIDYPTHNEGRGIVYPASESNPNDAWWKLPDMQHVFMHEMGHCVQWMPKQGKYIMEGVQDCDRQGYQEGWPDAVKVASKGYILATQKEEYQAAIAKSYRNPQSDKYFVWQVDYNTSGAFMSWLRLYNGDFVRMLPWTVLMDELTNQWSLEDAVKYILKESYPDLTMEELWNEYKTEVEVFLQNN